MHASLSMGATLIYWPVKNKAKYQVALIVLLYSASEYMSCANLILYLRYNLFSVDNNNWLIFSLIECIISILLWHKKTVPDEKSGTAYQVILSVLDCVWIIFHRPTIREQPCLNHHRSSPG